jgi:hypothetical protein
MRSGHGSVGEMNIIVVVCMGDVGGLQRGTEGRQSCRKGDR